jgi:hypothetical protein
MLNLERPSEMVCECPAALPALTGHGLSSQLAARASRFEFQKCSQLFIRTHNETLSVAAISVSKSRSFARANPTAVAQPHVQPDLLRLSAMISQYFTRRIGQRHERSDLLQLALPVLISKSAYGASKSHNLCRCAEIHIATAFLSMRDERGDCRADRQLQSGCVA